MYLVLLIIAIVVCALLVLMVLIQNPKGGGLSSNFSSSSQLMGVQKTGDFLEKGTWVLAITLMVLALAINVSVKNGTEKSADPQLKEKIDKASKPLAPANTPMSLPVAPQQQPVKK
ncbi:MAG TPA: preprotein translocase subunit SecG [Mucilaginibacter sp.]|jgi:preprotein translocase subunit SecG|nr:preprotein translocase subunit SecG [Mucilaginibacter sp.]